MGRLTDEQLGGISKELVGGLSVDMKGCVLQIDIPDLAAELLSLRREKANRIDVSAFKYPGLQPPEPWLEPQNTRSAFADLHDALCAITKKMCEWSKAHAEAMKVGCVSGDLPEADDRALGRNVLAARFSAAVLGAKIPNDDYRGAIHDALDYGFDAADEFLRRIGEG